MSLAGGLCSCWYGEQQLVVTSSETDGLSVYNAVTNSMQWNAKGTLPGVSKPIVVDSVCTSSQGHLFACDEANKCIHIFAVGESNELPTDALAP